VQPAETLAPTRRLLLAPSPLPLSPSEGERGRGEGAALEARLASVRLIQVALGDLMAPSVKGTVWEGYSGGRGWSLRKPRPETPPPGLPKTPAPATRPQPNPLEEKDFADTITALRQAFPSGHVDLDREISRTLALVEDDDPQTLDRIAGRLS